MRILASILLLGMLSLAAADDEVKLKNGDRLSGKVVGLAGGKLSLVTPETGPVIVDWTQIVSINSQDFQLRNEATLGTALGSGWDLLGGVITEYDRTPSPGLRRRDDTFFVGLGYTF